MSICTTRSLLAWVHVFATDFRLSALQLRDIAPEFYTTLKYHTSWIYVIWAFLTDSDVGPWTRMKRKTPTGTPADAPVMATGVGEQNFASCVLAPFAAAAAV